MRNEFVKRVEIILGQFSVEIKFFTSLELIKLSSGVREREIKGYNG